MRGIFGQPLDGGDQLTLGSGDRIRTGANWFSVDVYGASAALGDTAGKLSAFQVEDVPNYPEQGHFRFDIHLINTIVDVQFHNGFPQDRGDTLLQSPSELKIYGTVD